MPPTTHNPSFQRTASGGRRIQTLGPGMADEEREIALSMREALRRPRGHASLFEWATNRDLEEWRVATYFREELEHKCENFIRQLSLRGRGSDPSHCQFLAIEGAPRLCDVAHAGSFGQVLSQQAMEPHARPAAVLGRPPARTG